MINIIFRKIQSFFFLFAVCAIPCIYTTGLLSAEINVPASSVPATVVSLEPLKIVMLNPCYRNSIYAGQNLDEIELQIEFTLPQTQLDATKLLVKLYSPVTDKIFSQKEVYRPTALVRLSLPVKDLPVGDYKVTASLRDTENKEFFRCSEPLKKLPPVKGEVRITENLVTLVDGEPFLPFGWLSVGDDFERVAQQGCTAVHDYNVYFYDDATLKKWFDRAHKAGLKVVIYPFPERKMVDANAWQSPLSEEEAEKIKGFVNKWKTEPALLAWYLADEPEIRKTLPERVTAIYQLLREQDPYHPCTMLNYTLAGIRKYGAGSDILMPDPYFHFIKGGGPTRPLIKITKFMETIKKATDNKKPAWITPQGFNYGDLLKKLTNERAPNFIELRNITYQSVCGGAKGFLWYSYAYHQNYPDLTLGIPYLAKEVQILKKAILSADSKKSVQIFPANPAVVYSLREVADKMCLFLVNTSSQNIKLEFSIEGTTNLTNLYVVSTTRQLKSMGDKFADEFRPYETNIYTTDENMVKGSSTIDQIENEIKQAKSNLKKPDNLAFEELGATATASSSRYPAYAQHVLDGTVEDRGVVWYDTTPNEYPDWIEVTLPQIEIVSKVVVYTSTLKNYVVQVKTDAPEQDWKTVAQIEDNQQDMVVTEFTPIKTNKIRLWITATRGPTSRVSEIELYR